MTASRSPEVGTIVHFEHVNYRIPEHRNAHLYFCRGLGFTRDPTRMVGIDNMWVNLGRNQFHLQIGPATPFRGEVGVIVPDLDEVARRFTEDQPHYEGTQFSCVREGETLRTTTPWGHLVRVHPAGLLPNRFPQAIGYVELWVAPGTAAGIAAFYHDVIGCPAEVLPVEGAPTAQVSVGPGTTLRFAERPDGGAVPHTNHVAVYLSNYHATYEKLSQLGCIMQEDADEQFRFHHMKDPKTKRLLFSFEHEMRSLHHPDFGKPLINRVELPWRRD
jgi:hypothetical protein